MDYIPNTDQELEQMLQAIGIHSFDDLIASVPTNLRKFRVKLPPPLTEMELIQEMSRITSQNQSVRQVLSFLGAGAYDHFIPSAVDHLTMRGEFYTAYTPYQAEASQGTLQATYEYQSFICALTGMEVSNASLYDGSSAFAEAGFLSLNTNPGRKKIVVASSIHPDYRLNLRTYLSGHEIEIVEIPSPIGVVDLDQLQKLVDDNTCAVFAQNPNFFGCLEPMIRISEIARAKGALFIASVNPISLGLLKPPGEYNADFAVGEGQPLGIPLSYGGPWLGFLASKRAHVHKISGRIAGCSVDEVGETAFCLTLQAREQHIRREKAASNICTNQSLMALRACIYLALVGKQGLTEVAQLNYRRAHDATKAIVSLPGFSLTYQQPFFNEFSIRCPVKSVEIVKALEKDGVEPGVPLGKYNKEWEKDLLICLTETKTEADIARLSKLLARFKK